MLQSTLFKLIFFFKLTRFTGQVKEKFQINKKVVAVTQTLIIAFNLYTVRWTNAGFRRTINGGINKQKATSEIFLAPVSQPLSKSEVTL